MGAKTCGLCSAEITSADPAAALCRVCEAEGWLAEAEADRDRLAARVAELERERDAMRAAANRVVNVISAPVHYSDPHAVLTAIRQILAAALAPPAEGGGA
jgi:hypothetical protein